MACKQDSQRVGAGPSPMCPRDQEWSGCWRCIPCCGRLATVHLSPMCLSRWECVVVEPLSLAVLGAAALTQGIGFLCGQLGELIRRRRERRAQSDAASAEVGEIPPPGEAGRYWMGHSRPNRSMRRLLSVTPIRWRRCRGSCSRMRRGTDRSIRPIGSYWIRSRRPGSCWSRSISSTSRSGASSGPLPGALCSRRPVMSGNTSAR